MENHYKGEYTPVGYSACLCERQLYKEVTEEFNLPDYQPEIRKLLRINTTVVQTNKYVSGTGGEIGGTLEYDVLYLSDDGRLYSAVTETNYSFDLTTDTVPDEYGECCVIAEVGTTGSNGRVLSPRKFSVKTKLYANAVCTAKAEYNMKTVGEGDGGCVRVLTDDMKYASVCRGCEDSLLLSDEIIPEQKPGEIRIIGSMGKVMITEATATKGCIVCRGEAIVRILLCHGDDGEPENIIRKIRFVREVPCEEAEPGYDCSAEGKCKKISVTVGEGRIVCDTEITLDCTGMKNVSVAYPKEVYAVDRPTQETKTDRHIINMKKCHTGNFTQSGVFGADEVHIPKDAIIIDVTGTANAGSIEYEKGRVGINGEVRYCVVYKNGEEYGERDIVQQIKYETDLRDADTEPPISGIAGMDVVQVRYGMDGERISIDAEICVNNCLYTVEKESMTDEVKMGGNVKRRNGEITVVYPDSDDTLWNISKRYMKDAETTAAANGIKTETSPDDPSTLKNTHFLVM